MLRWYQEEAIQSIFRYFEGAKGNPLIAMPTASGKSHVIAGFVHRVFNMWPSQRFLIATHVKELITQDISKLVDAWPLAPIGVFSAGLGKKEADKPITFGGVASIAKSLHLFGHIDLMFVDEAHLIGEGENTLYQKIIAHLKSINPYLKVIGLTATPFRMGQGMLTDGNIFTDICYDLTSMHAFNRLVAEGYLSPLIPKRTRMRLDTKGVGINRATGDFNQKELQTAVDRDEITYAALQEAMEYAYDRRSWLVFSSGVDHAEHITNMLATFGVSAVCVTNNTPPKERDEKIKAYKAGHVRALVGNNIFTTGFDHPYLDCIISLRPTLSVVLWVQMLGRGTRIADGKQNCLVLDFAGNSRKLGPINDPMIPVAKGKGNGPPPIKLCEKCGVENHIAVRFCINCGNEFIFDVKFHQSAFEDELIKQELPIVEKFDVQYVIYNEHTARNSGMPTLEVIYYCNNNMHRFKEYVNLEHSGFAGKKARDWWRMRHFTEPPATIKEALRYISELRPPKRIRVHVNKKYPEVLGYEW